MKRFAIALFSVVVLACGGATKESGAPAVGTSGPKDSSSASGDAKPTASGVTQVACGDFHSCALFGDGTVKCWGRNKEGEIGDGTSDNRAKPTPVAGVQGAVQIAGTAHSTCALLKDGTVACWGGGKSWNDGKDKDNVAPTPVAGIKDATAIDGGGLLLCALVKGGKVQCWGEDDSAKSSKVHPPDANATQITVAEAHGCALVADGGVACWGDGAWGGVGPVSFASPAIRGAKQVSTGDSVTCALLSTGAVSCFGRNEQGELGRAPDQDYHAKPQEVPGLSGVKHVVAGEAHLCAILADGSAQCWGSNGDGELGRGVQGEPQAPGALKLDHVESIALGADHGCAKTSDGAVYCWGSNAHGQIGDGTTEGRLVPTKVVF